MHIEDVQRGRSALVASNRYTRPKAYRERAGDHRTLIRFRTKRMAESPALEYIEVHLTRKELENALAELDAAEAA